MIRISTLIPTINTLGHDSQQRTYVSGCKREEKYAEAQFIALGHNV